MRILLSLLLVLLSTVISKGQELFVSTEPASNMPSHSIGVRLNNYFMPSYKEGDNMFRFNPQIMWGINKYLMVHYNLFASNMHQSSFNFEGQSIYLKYRFLSVDNPHRHFRMALYGKGSMINNPLRYSEINLYGDNSGYSAGLVATQLLHKLAISYTGGLTKAISNLHSEVGLLKASSSLNNSLSFGYLVYPKKYKGYNDVNINLYAEFMNKFNIPSKEYFLDIAPAIQFIFKSKMIIDLSYRRLITGNMARINNQEYILRLEYNLFNAY